MSSINPKANLDGIVHVEPVRLKAGSSVTDVQGAMDIFSRTVRKHTVAPGFMAGFIVLDNQGETADPVILLTLFWQSQHALNEAEDNALYQVLYDDILIHCQDLNGQAMHAKNLPRYLAGPRARIRETQTEAWNRAQSSHVH